jgi:hypothetical protein
MRSPQTLGEGRSDALQASKDKPTALQPVVGPIMDSVASTARESLSERLKRLNDKFEPRRNPEGGFASTIQGQGLSHRRAQDRPSEDLKGAMDKSSKGIELGRKIISHQARDHPKQQEIAGDGNEDTTDDEAESIDCNSPIIHVKERQAQPTAFLYPLKGNADDEKSQESPILWTNVGNTKEKAGVRMLSQYFML